MKNLKLLFLLIITSASLHAQNLKPYMLGLKSSEPLITLKEKIASNLEKNGIEIIGQYQPANDNKRWIFIFTSPELKTAVQKFGGITGFAASLRVALTSENGKTLVTYTNPNYWGNAYFRKDFSEVAASYHALNTKLEKAMAETGQFRDVEFGSKKGLSEKSLRKYHYMFGMPYFDDTIKLQDFSSFQQAVQTIEKNASNPGNNLDLLYKIDIPGKDLSLFGFGLKGEKGESKFLPIIDIDNPKHTAFLPYEILVTGKEVHMLHGRYRIAIAFPDLTMGTFSKIMSTPGDIEESLELLVK